MLIRVMVRKIEQREKFLQERALLQAPIASIEHATQRLMFNTNSESRMSLIEDVAQRINTDKAKRTLESEQYFMQQLKALVGISVQKLNSNYTVVVKLESNALQILVMDERYKPCKWLDKSYTLTTEEVA